MTQQEAIFKAFIHPGKKDRFLTLLSKSDRSKLTSQFAHGVKLDFRFAEQIPPKLQNVNDIEKMLKSKGATSNCFVISENSQLDEKEMPLREALIATIGQGMGTFISCIPGKLAYFEAEEANERYILSRASA
jgi:hypothetical protein